MSSLHCVGVMAAWACVWMVWCGVGVAGMSNFVPQEACTSMNPDHNAAPQGSTPPYSLKAQNTQQGDVQVVLSGSTGTAFRGFFVKGFDGATGGVVGSFDATADATPITCNQPEGGAGVHHSSPSDKDSVVLMWQPPPGYSGTVTFMATVVQTREVYWTDVISNSISVP